MEEKTMAIEWWEEKLFIRRLVSHSSSFRVPAAEKIFSTALFEPTGIGKSLQETCRGFLLEENRKKTFPKTTRGGSERENRISGAGVPNQPIDYDCQESPGVNTCY